MTRSIIDQDELPAKFPTHRHSPEFWESLGRAVATFGFLEEVLGKAIFAFTATRRYGAEEIETAYEKWRPTLEHALSDTLRPLAIKYGNVVQNNPENTTENIDGLVDEIKNAAEIRNVLCHGSWRSPGQDGKSVPLFVNNRNEVFETPIDVAYLEQVQCHVAGLACAVMDSVTHMGFQFPGGIGPGRPI